MTNPTNTKHDRERRCPSCGKAFSWKRYFDKQGRSIGFRGGRAGYCSKHCAYEAQRNDWAVDKHGYKYCTSNGKMIYEHRIVMERNIGRPLTTQETVHHKNGDRADNRIENLELWSSRHGKGQRVSDMPLHIFRDSTWVNGLLSL